MIFLFDRFFVILSSYWKASNAFFVCRLQRKNHQLPSGKYKQIQLNLKSMIIRMILYNYFYFNRILIHYTINLEPAKRTNQHWIVIFLKCLNKVTSRCFLRHPTTVHCQIPIRIQHRVILTTIFSFKFLSARKFFNLRI